MSKIQLGSESVRVVDSGGAGTAIVFVHGNSLHSGSWEYQLGAKELAGFRRVAIDLPGHGQSAPSPDPARRYSLRGYGESLAALIDALELERVVVVGHSMGGHSAIEIAPQIPQLVGVVVFGTPPLRSLEDMPRGFRETPLLRFIGAPELGEAEANEWARGMFAPDFEPPSWAAAAIRSVDPQARPCLGASLTPEHFVDEVDALRRLSPPAALLHGEHDAMVNLDYLRALDAPLWRGGVQVLEGAGHSPQWERPEAFNRLLRAYLDEALEA
jgi:pimeloyl-ACP methyl ester carboxylesterase